MINVGIIGTGNIGTDLLIKLLKLDFVNLKIFVGRRKSSDGIKLAKKLKVKTSDSGIDFFKKNKRYCDLIYDCTNAISAIEHAKVFKSQGIKVIDLTPAKIGKMCVPILNSKIILKEPNVNMITCGGQASIPILELISKFSDINYIEIVSQISSFSAGMSTRINIDNYIETTESAINYFTGSRNSKVILNLNPAVPEVDMQTTIFVKASNINFTSLNEAIFVTIKKLKNYVPNYELIVPPILTDDTLILSVKVKGLGDYLPQYAGNLDIINCAAIELTKELI